MQEVFNNIERIFSELLFPLVGCCWDAVCSFDLLAFLRWCVDFAFHLSLTHYLLLGAALFTIGLLGVLTRRNLIAAIISIELMLNAANINFLAFAQYFGDAAGSVMVIFVLALAASEVAVGLAIGLALYRAHGTIDMEQFQKLRG